MTRIRVETLIAAPPEICFDFARDMSLHAKTMAHTGEKIVSGPARPLELGDEVVFEARHFGVRQRLSSKISQFDRPRLFTDEMTSGAFKSLRHEHRFEPCEAGTRMVDVLEFSAPFGPVGWCAERLLLSSYMSRLLRIRGERLRALIEADGNPTASD